MATNFISTLILVAIVILVVVYKRKKAKASSWKGELVKKRDITDEDDENHVYRLIFKTDAGKKEKVSVSEKIFDQAKVGERYEKIAGERVPQKLS
jgi:hypothetical protein